MNERREGRMRGVREGSILGIVVSLGVFAGRNLRHWSYMVIESGRSHPP
jgi:hypothetical protein